ncbi:putative zinc finger and BTB domain-containing protein 7C [Penaeus vannamei]|uniref:Putative zinc finger and BTB domain-containing protein 7C n=1 Tax=Penaeus vannamei TaxID=6689 RepID=A0A3R7LT39_PENVA|nr:putative zinc finger and BTB domain-containing protein 7C [Penaeus vannamei]
MTCLPLLETWVWPRMDGHKTTDDEAVNRASTHDMSATSGDLVWTVSKSRFLLPTCLSTGHWVSSPPPPDTHSPPRPAPRYPPHPPGKSFSRPPVSAAQGDPKDRDGFATSSPWRRAGVSGRRPGISTPTHAQEVQACVRNLRHVVSTADVSIVVRSDVFRVHRFLVAHFSRFLARALSPRAGEAATSVVCVEDVDADSMAHLLDYMYGNLAILKESKLLRFLCAARRLEIDCLQTPGLKSLETNLTRSLNATPCGASFSEGRETGGVTGGDRGGETSRNILLPNVKFPASLEITEKPKAIGGHSGDGRNCGATHSREQASERKNEENTGTKEQSKCCCHCSCRREGEAKSARVKESSDERSETKEGRTLSPEELEAETLRQKLEKCGTKITGNAMSMLQVPAWIFSSKNISITPAKEISKNVTVSAADQSTAGKAPLAAQGRTDETDAPVIIGTSPPKPPVPPKRNLMPAFQASPRLQGHGYFPKGDLRYPGPRGSHGGARGPHSVSQRYPGPRYMAPNINSVPRIQQNQRNRLQTPYPRMMPNAVPDRVPLTQKSSRGHGYGTPPPHRNIFNALGQSTPSSDAGNVSIRMDRKLSQQPRVIVNNILSSQGRSPHSPSGRGRRGRCSRGRRLSLLYPYSPSSDRDVTNQPGGSQDHANGLDEERPSPSGKSSLHWKWNEPVEVKDTGIIIQLPDNVAEVIAGAPVLTPAAPGLDNRRSLDFQLAESGPSSYRAPVSSVEGPSVEGPSMEGPSVEGVCKGRLWKIYGRAVKHAAKHSRTADRAAEPFSG